MITEISYNAFCMQWHVKMVLIYDGTELTEVFSCSEFEQTTSARRRVCRKMHTAARNRVIAYFDTVRYNRRV